MNDLIFASRATGIKANTLLKLRLPDRARDALLRAADSISEAADTLDTTGRDCPECHRQRYNNFPHVETHKALRAIITKLRKIAEQGTEEVHS